MHFVKKLENYFLAKPLCTLPTNLLERGREIEGMCGNNFVQSIDDDVASLRKTLSLT